MRRLHGARRAWGTSLCPGHILLFGHVNILFLSLLSKSLPIKGREARPGRERGRAENMPRNTKNSRASASTGDERDQPLVLSGDEDAVAPPRRLDEGVYEQLRAIQRSFTKEMYDYAVAYLQRTLQRTKTEGVGDCWLLSIMGGFEVKDPKLVRKLNDEQRESICTSPCHRDRTLKLPRGTKFPPRFGNHTDVPLTAL